MRMVLCNAIDPVRRTFTMYTNRESRKGRVEWTPDEACDAYFASRPLEARLGAWASRQSEPAPSRAALLTELAAVADRFDAREETDVVPRPPFWGGFTLVAGEPHSQGARNADSALIHEEKLLESTALRPRPAFFRSLLGLGDRLHPAAGASRLRVGD
jgi:pyridoxine/pyridoxamine 5'-phosphate oxidase